MRARHAFWEHDHAKVACIQKPQKNHAAVRDSRLKEVSNPAYLSPLKYDADADKCRDLSIAYINQSLQRGDHQQPASLQGCNEFYMAAMCTMSDR